MRLGFIAAGIVSQVSLCDLELADRWAAHLGCDAWLHLPDTDLDRLRKLVPGATVANVEAARLPGSLGLDPAKIGAITPPADA
jgi:hypothetical protein